MLDLMDKTSRLVAQKRAEELARSGHFKAIPEIIAALEWEGYRHSYLGGPGTIFGSWLQSLINRAEHRRFDA